LWGLGTALEPLELVVQRGCCIVDEHNGQYSPSCTEHNDYTTECLQSEAFSALLQQRMVQEVFPAHSNRPTQ